MKYKILILTVVLLVLGVSLAQAGNSRRIGTAGAQELRIPIGSRGTALGGSIVANVSGVEAIYWNPAGLSSMAGTEAMFSHQPYIADINVNFIGMATNIEGFGNLGGTVKIVSIGDMEETTDEFPDGTGRIYSPSLSVISLTYSKILTYRVSFGVTTKFIYEKIFEVSASGVAFDVGFMYDPDWHGLKFGLAIMNYGPEMKFSGSGFNRDLGGRQGAAESASFDLPSSFNLGLSYDVINLDRNVATFTGNFLSNNYSQDIWQGGAEYVYDGKYSLRAGYNYSDQQDYLYGFTVGAGAAFELAETKLTFEYSWNDTEFFDNNQFFTVKVNF